MSSVTPPILSTNRYEYRDFFGVSGQIYNRAVSLIKCEGTTCLTMIPSALAGLVALVASAVAGVIELPVKIVANTGIFFANKIMNLIYGAPVVPVPNPQAKKAFIEQVKDTTTAAWNFAKQNPGTTATAVGAGLGAVAVGAPAAAVGAGSYLIPGFMAGYIPAAVATGTGFVTGVATTLGIGAGAGKAVNYLAKDKPVV